MSKILTLTIIVILLFQGAVFVVLAEEDSLSQSDSKDSRLYWISVGIGRGASEFSDGYVFCSSSSQQYRHCILSTRFIIMTTSYSNWLTGFEHTKEVVWDLGLMIGERARSEHVSASLSAGLSLVRDIKFHRVYENPSLNENRHYEKSDNFTMGIPIEVQWVYILANDAALGLYGYADINSINKLFGLALCIQFGRLR